MDAAKNLAKPSQSIELHTERTLAVGQMILEKNEDLVKWCAENLPFVFFKTENDKEKEVRNFIMSLIKYHDYGKVNPHFQKFISGEDTSGDKMNREHSIFSFYLWLNDFLKENNVGDEYSYARVNVAYSTITGHHGVLKNFYDEFSTKEKHDGHKAKANETIKLWEGVLTEEEYSKIWAALKKIRKENIKKINPLTEKQLLFTKLCFSILVLADSISSSDTKEEEYQLLVDDVIGRNVGKTNKVKFTTLYDESAIKKAVDASDLLSTDQFSNARKVKDIKDLRVLVNKKIAASIDKNVDIYVIESPVGSGKTFSSLGLAQQLINKEKKKKIINVFPLNSVQTQFANTLEEELQVPEEMVNIVNSQDIFGYQEYEEKEQQLNQNNLWLFRRECFSNEIIVTSHVRFFETLAGVRRKSAVGLLALKDAVVIIDEFQNYSEKYWTHIWNELLLVSETFGTKFIFTSGTFPVARKEIEKFGNKVKFVFDEEERKELFNSPYIKGRCHIQMMAEEYYKYKETEVLADDIALRIRMKEKEGYNQYIVCMNFIQLTKDIHKKMKEEFGKEYAVYFLCGRDKPEYKKELMKKIKKHNENREDKVILVTTKTVECGMDFDFDYGFKEYDRFDSVEQLSGRINRHGKKNDIKPTLDLFFWDRKKMGEEKTLSISFEEEKLIEDINEKRFDKLYNTVYEKNLINLKERAKDMQEINKEMNLKEYIDKMKVIEDNDYLKTIYLLNQAEEMEFETILKRMPYSDHFATKKINSLMLSQKLKKFEINVTSNWLSDVCDKKQILHRKEISGFDYYLVTPDSEGHFFENCVEVYEIDGIESMIESIKYKSV